MNIKTTGEQPQDNKGEMANKNSSLCRVCSIHSLLLAQSGKKGVLNHSVNP